MFNLTPNQKIAAQQFFKSGNLYGVHGNTIHALENKGVIAFTDEKILTHRKPYFTPEGQTWANVQFVTEQAHDDVEAQFEDLCERETFYVNAAERATSDTTRNFIQKQLVEIRGLLDLLVAQIEA